MTPSGTRGLLNDALSIYFGDATLASGTQAGRRKSLGDSPLEGGVSCELVSEVKFASRAPMGRFHGDWERFLVP